MVEDLKKKDIKLYINFINEVFGYEATKEGVEKAGGRKGKLDNLGDLLDTTRMENKPTEIKKEFNKVQDSGKKS